MKTPRELILERHRTSAVKLDLQGKDLAAYASPRPVLRAWWEESIWPWRRIWIGLAPVWVIIAVLNLSSRDEPESQARRPDPQVMMAWREQNRFMTQVLQPALPADKLKLEHHPARPGIPRPRSENRPTI